MTPKHIANFILENAEKSNMAMTQLRLQKLIYFMYGWTLVLTKTKVFDKESLEWKPIPSKNKLFDEEFLAWKHGPVSRSVYDDTKQFSDKSIPLDYRLSDGSKYPAISENEEETIQILKRIWESYKSTSVNALRAESHDEAWEDAKNTPDNKMDSAKINSEFENKREIIKKTICRHMKGDSIKNENDFKLVIEKLKKLFMDDYNITLDMVPSIEKDDVIIYVPLLDYSFIGTMNYRPVKIDEELMRKVISGELPPDTNVFFYVDR